MHLEKDEIELEIVTSVELAGQGGTTQLWSVLHKS